MPSILTYSQQQSASELLNRTLERKRSRLGFFARMGAGPLVGLAWPAIIALIIQILQLISNNLFTAGPVQQSDLDPDLREVAGEMGMLPR